MDNNDLCHECAIYKFALYFANANRHEKKPCLLPARDVYNIFVQWCAKTDSRPAGVVSFGRIFAGFIASRKRRSFGMEYVFVMDEFVKRALAAKFKHEHDHRLSFAKSSKAIKKRNTVKRVIQLDIGDDLAQFGEFLCSKHKSLTDTVTAGGSVDDLELMSLGYMKSWLDEFVSQKK